MEFAGLCDEADDLFTRAERSDPDTTDRGILYWRRRR
jgi:hypothetical protein